MSLPVVYMDALLLASILVAVLAVRFLVGWLLARQRITSSGSESDSDSSEARHFLQLMGRADHALDNFITSIQGHLSVLGEELPTDAQR